MHGQDGPSHNASQGQVSTARRFGKPAEDVEDVRLRSRLYSATSRPALLTCPSSGLSVPCLPPCRTWLAVRVRGARTINSRNRSSEPRNVASCRTSSSVISPSRLSAVKRSPTPWRELDVLPGSRPLMPVFLRAFPLKDDSASVSKPRRPAERLREVRWQEDQSPRRAAYEAARAGRL